MITSIIIEYLRDNRRLVIPGLGAFLRKEGGETVFAPFLNKDDGVLSGLVGQNFGSPDDEARQIVEQYVAGVEQALADRGAYFVSGLGSLRRDAGGTLVLDPAVRPEEPAAAPSETAAPKTLYDRLLEERQRESPGAPAPAVPPTREPVPHRAPVREAPRPQTPTTSRPHTTPAAAPRPEPKATDPAPQTGRKSSDLVLILAIVVAAIAVAAMVYAYTSVGGPTFNLN
jgi:hypothetical protein